MRFERSARVYRRLLRALPVDFRERYADELVEIFLSTMLVGVTATDPATFAVISLSLTAVAPVARYAPGRRATRVDPLRTMRAD